MPNSIDGIKARILANQIPQASEDRTAERIASAVSKVKTEIHKKFMAATSAADAVRSAERRLKIKIGYALESVYELRCQLRPDPADRRTPMSSNASTGMWSAENSEYSITELVRLVFGDKLRPAFLEACVERVQLAEKENITPENFRWFMKNVGRIDVNVRVVNKLAK